MEVHVRRVLSGVFVCADPRFQVWRPNFSSSGQGDPTWTRMSCGGVELLNTTEWADFDVNPVQVRICEQCGHIGCDSGGYVHISRLGDFVLWTAPQEDEIAAFSIEKFGAIAFPRVVWESRFVRAATLPPANHRAVADAWICGPGRPFDPNKLVKMLRARLVACDTLETGRAIGLVSALLDDLLARPEEPFAGRLANASELGARIETLYFDGPAKDDWPALAFVGDTPHIAFTRELIAV